MAKYQCLKPASKEQLQEMIRLGNNVMKIATQLLDKVAKEQGIRIVKYSDLSH